MIKQTILALACALMAGCGSISVTDLPPLPDENYLPPPVVPDVYVGPLDGEWYIVWEAGYVDDCLSIEQDVLVWYGTCDGYQYGDFAGDNDLAELSPLDYNRYEGRPYSFTVALYEQGSVVIFDLVISSRGMVELVDAVTGELYLRGVLGGA